ncbi:hypothetical protein ACJ72_07249, partial [Emergomyces africanus]
PKTKNFARIRAALLEEVAPVDFECQREAEVIRQVRESDGGDLPPLSPSLTTPLDSLESHNLDTQSDSLPTGGQMTSSSIFAQPQTSGIGRLTAFGNRYETPPPPPPPPSAIQAIGTAASASTTDDTTMQTQPSAFPGAPTDQFNTSTTTATINNITHLSTPHAGASGPSRVEAEASRKNNKRRRDEMIDMHAFKRRAVSPGMSAQNSPVASSQHGSLLSKETSRLGAGGGGPGRARARTSGGSSRTVLRLRLRSLERWDEG